MNGKMNSEDSERPVTVSDLKLLKKEIINEIRKLAGTPATMPQRPWMKSYEVQRLLKISAGSLQHLRDSGQLKFSRIGRIIFYDKKDVEEMIKNNMAP